MEAEERKKQRELKKFGKKVQTAKLLERAKEKKYIHIPLLVLEFLPIYDALLYCDRSICGDVD